MKTVWCVKDREDRWCAVKGGSKPDETAGSVPTVCDHFIVLPHGTEKRRPNCPDCRSVLVGAQP